MRGECDRAVRRNDIVGAGGLGIVGRGVYRVDPKPADPIGAQPPGCDRAGHREWIGVAVAG